MKKLILLSILLVVGCEETLEPQDCAGVAGGTAGLDSCAVCIGGTTNLTACVQDCAEDWGGIAVLDSCDVCDADSSNDCIADCNGDYGGTAVEDECGVCDSDSTNDGTTDNCGTCDKDSSNDCVQDDCGVWGGNNTPLTGTCDCAGTPNGDATTDNCGTCDTASSNDCVQDCAGVFSGDSVEDNCGTCDNDAANDCIQDCNEDWGGIAVLDQCGVCNGDLSSCSGCTDYEAENYDSDAIIDDGSCTFSPYNGYHSLRFDGMDDYVIVDNIVPDNIGFTISGWIKIDNDASGNLNVFCYGESMYTPGAFYVRFVDLETSYEPRLYVGDGEWSYWGGGGSLYRDTWYHITALITDEKWYKLLINGTQVSAVKRDDHQLATSAIFSIGASPSGTDHFQGIIDEVAVWSANLEDNVTEIYNLGMFYEDVNSFLDLDPNLEGYWRLNEGRGTIVTDLSGNNHHGTIFGAEWLDYDHCAVDNCGTCDTDTTNDCVQDCSGEWGGTDWLSDCGCVPADNSGNNCCEVVAADNTCIQLSGCVGTVILSSSSYQVTVGLVNNSPVELELIHIYFIHENEYLYGQPIDGTIQVNGEYSYIIDLPPNIYGYTSSGNTVVWVFKYGDIEYPFTYYMMGIIGNCN